MTDEARAARSEYMKAWRAKNPGKEKIYKERYWQRRAEGGDRSEKNFS